MFVFSIPNSIGTEIEKVCRGIYPLQNVNIRKVKVLKKPKFDGKNIDENFFLINFWNDYFSSCTSYGNAR